MGELTGLGRTNDETIIVDRHAGDADDGDGLSEWGLAVACCVGIIGGVVVHDPTGIGQRVLRSWSSMGTAVRGT